MNKFAGLTSQRAPVVEEPEAPQPAAQGEQVRMLGGRVPDSIFREFTFAKLSAEADLHVKKVTTEEGLEAIVRALRDPVVRERWLAELQTVRRGRRES